MPNTCLIGIFSASVAVSTTLGATPPAERGVRFGLANVNREVRDKLEHAGVLKRIGTDSVFPTLNAASNAFLSRTRA
jgi:hypothetical protein